MVEFISGPTLFPFLKIWECYPVGKDVISLFPVKNYFSVDLGVDLRCPLQTLHTSPSTPLLTAWEAFILPGRVYSYHSGGLGCFVEKESSLVH